MDEKITSTTLPEDRSKYLQRERLAGVSEGAQTGFSKLIDRIKNANWGGIDVPTGKPKGGGGEPGPLDQISASKVIRLSPEEYFMKYKIPKEAQFNVKKNIIDKLSPEYVEQELLKMAQEQGWLRPIDVEYLNKP